VTEPLVVRSNIARDILQTADEFGSVPKMTVEYVSNGLDNPNDPTQPVTVRVDIRRYGRNKTITISDDGCGMDDTALAEFFVMHRENAQRQRGRRARGRFGTGKSAGFGVGTAVTIDTVRDGRQWIVELTADELRSASREDRPPQPEIKVDGAATDRANGTTVTVTGVTRQAKPVRIANELRRRLGRQLESHRVYVAGERVHLVEPEPAQSWEFDSTNDEQASAELGRGVVCTINAVAAGDSVDEAVRGVVVTSRDVPVAQYQALGDLSNRIFGLCEVPALDDDTSTPGPFTDRRDMTLNVDNPLASAVDAWVKRCLEQATRELQEQERERLRRARDQELQRAASRAEAVLNEHYKHDFRITAGAGSQGGTSVVQGSGGGDLIADEDGEQVIPTADGVAGYGTSASSTDGDSQCESDGADEGHTRDGADANEQPGTDRSPQLHERDSLGDGRGDSVSELDAARRRRARGGFRIDYSNTGMSAPRAAFYESELTIVINLDHPLLASVSSDRDLFQGLAFTIAAEEYSQATANELLARGQLEDAYEALNYERMTMDKLSRAFAEVFTTLASPTVVSPDVAG
jgi:hypothetical protein